MTRRNSASPRGLVLLLAAMVTASPAIAQEPSGPLDAPAPASAVAKPARHSTAHRAKAAATAKRTAVPASARLPVATPAMPTADVAASKPVPPTDPVSFGMKWNGSNDNAAQTRIENLNGNATGTGAEVGMKLHF